MDNVVIMSLWKNDQRRNLTGRIEHLLSKTYPALRWVWVVGDSQDDTERILMEAALIHSNIEVVRWDTGITAEDSNSRVLRLSQTANAGLDCVRRDDDYWIIHESDLISPPDLVERFLATGKCPIAGWVTLGPGGVFYDTWAYRRNGAMLSNSTPRPAELFELDSVGSVWMMHAEDVRAGMRCERKAVLDLCRQMKAAGRRFWCDPGIDIIQPKELWESRTHASDF